MNLSQREDVKFKISKLKDWKRMSKFLKDSEERQQDFKKHQEFRSRNRKGF